MLLTSTNARLHFHRMGRERLRIDEVGKRKKGHLAWETARCQYWFGGVKERRGHSESSKNYQSHIKIKKKKFSLRLPGRMCMKLSKPWQKREKAGFSSTGEPGILMEGES